MSIVLQVRGGTTVEHSTFIGAGREVTVDTSKNTLVVHDGMTAGGHVLAKASEVNNKVDKINGKQLSTEDYTSAEKTKLSGIAAGAQVNVPTDLSLGTATGTTLPLNSSTGTDIVLPAVTTTTAGLMSSTDKTKLDGLSNYSKPASEPISYITGLQTALDSKATTTALNTEKGRIDAILASAGANTDTFAEIVTLINSVDTTNDTAFAGYVTSNNSRSTTIETNITNLTNNKVDKVAGKQLSTEDYTTAEKTKLDGIETGANNYVLPNASSIKIGGIKVSATTQTVAANAVTTTASRTYAVQLDASGNALVNVPWVDNNTVYTHPTSGVTAGTYKSVTVDANGHVTGGTNPTTLAGYGITDAAPSSHVGSTGSAHGVATTSTAGFMSAADKTKLDGIATGANNYSLPVASSTVYGGIKVSATTQTVAANAVTTTASRTYAVQLDASGNALVNVPWEDTNTVYTHPNSGITAGTYKSVTVNAAGHVTAGTNPTTLAGYGITDAAPSSHVGSTGSAHGVATTSTAGFMSAADKTKLDNIGTVAEFEASLL